MAKQKKKRKNNRKLAIQIFAIVLCVLMAALTIISSYMMVKGM